MLSKPHFPRASSAQLPFLLGPYVDVFDDCGALLVLGCGSGSFLDSAGLRSIPCEGFEQDPRLAARARAKGHRIHPLGPEALQDFPSAFDGIYLGRSGDGLTAEDLPRLFALVSHALQKGGVFLLRRPKESLVRVRPQQLRAWAEKAGLGAIQIASVQGDKNDFFLYAEKKNGGSSSTLASPLALALAPADSLDARIDAKASPLENPMASLFDLECFERRKWSQCGEDGVLEAIFRKIGVTNRFFVEFGCGDGLQCNGANLIRQGWRGLMMDGIRPSPQNELPIQQEWISAESICPLFEKYGVPKRFDLLSIDIDGNDYWVWKALPHRPRVVVIEYNGNLPPHPNLTIPYDPDFRWNGSDHYGASLGALAKLGQQKGYQLVYCTQSGVNAFFVDEALLPEGPRPSLEEIYRPAHYFYRGIQHPHDPHAAWVEV